MHLLLLIYISELSYSTFGFLGIFSSVLLYRVSLIKKVTIFFSAMIKDKNNKGKKFINKIVEQETYFDDI